MKKHCYIWGEDLIHQCDRLPAVDGRASMVHSLIHSYGLLSQLKIVQASQASYNDLKLFHSEHYLDHLKTFTEYEDEDYMANKRDEEHGIGYDCPPVSNMFELVSAIAGGTVTAAKCLLLGDDVAVNWCGGWHHAQRSSAEGFCYVNDIVIGIEMLRKKFPKVLYVDLDAHHVSNMFELVSAIAGGTVTAAKCLLLGDDVAVNWCGGWHHAQRSSAEGFCYVNDIVIGIEMLRKKFPKVLYVDLDAHHGNGVENAYSLSESVFTLSLHKFEPGFFPGTGGLEDIGTQNGKGFSCNFPLHAGYSDETMEYAFDKVFDSVYTHFAPDAVVVQCGADALAHDRVGGGRLSIRGYRSCLKTVLGKKKPTMLLGGGGYNNANAARLWVSLTALVTGVELDENIPEHSHWPSYGPDFTLSMQPTLAKDMNKRSYVDECIDTIQGNLEKYLPISKIPEPNKQKTEYIRVIRNCDINVDSAKPIDVYEFVD